MITHEHLQECKQTVTTEFSKLLGEHIEDEEARYERIERQLDQLMTQHKGISDDVKSLMQLFEQSKGAVTIVKWIIMGVAGFWAFVVWFNNHVRI